MIDETHPEYRCNDCNKLNPTWYASNELFNEFCAREEIICPVCFQDRANKNGVVVMFEAKLIKRRN